MTRKLPQIVRVNCNEVRTGRNYRKFSRAQLGDLLVSIQRHGVLQNPIVTSNTFQDSDEKPYELVAGERRFRCCQILGRGLEVLFYPVLTAEEFEEIQLAENVKRAFNPGETALSTWDFYKSLIAEKLGLTENHMQKYTPQTLPEEYRRALPLTDFAVIRGKDVSTVRDYFAFASLDRRVQQLVTRGRLDYSLAVVISRLPEDRQLSTAVKFKGSASELESQIKAEQHQETTLTLTDIPEAARKTNELGSYISSANRILKAGIEYFKSSKTRFNGQLKSIIDPALEYLYSLRREFEQRAEADGKLDMFRALTAGKKAHKEHVLETHFDVSGKPAEDLEGRLMWIDPELIDPDKDQPRKTFDKEAMKELEESIAEIGQRQPGMVYQTGNGRYALVFGERRLRAIKANNKRRIDKGEKPDKYLAKVVSPMTPVQRRLTQYEEDCHQQDRPEERAEVIYGWVRRRKKAGTKLETHQIIDRMGIGRTAVRKALNYASVSKAIKTLYSRGLLTYEAAAEFASIPKNQQRDLGFRVYLAGGNLKAARQVISLHNEDKQQPGLFASLSAEEAEKIKSDFSHIFLRDLRRQFPAQALARLKGGDIYSAPFVSGVYSMISGLEKLRKYASKK